MSKLIENLKQKYSIFELDDTILKGHSSNIVLKNYCFEIQETDNVEPLRIEFHQCHKNNKPIENYFKITLVNSETGDEPQDLFFTDKYSKLVNFITSLLE